MLRQPLCSGDYLIRHFYVNRLLRPSILVLPQAPPAVSQSDSDDTFGTPSESLLTRNRSIFFSGDSGKEIALCHFDLKQTGDQWHEKFS
jgi:hypothetical protein